MQETAESMWDKKNQHQLTYSISLHPQLQPCDMGTTLSTPQETEAQRNRLIDPRPPGRQTSEQGLQLTPVSQAQALPNHGDGGAGGERNNYNNDNRQHRLTAKDMSDRTTSILSRETFTTTLRGRDPYVISPMGTLGNGRLSHL